MFWSDWKFGKDRLVAGGITVAIVVLQVGMGFVKPEYEWPQIRIITQVYAVVVGLWLLWRIVCTPWHLQRDLASRHELLVGQHGTELTVLKAQIADLQEQLQAPRLLPKITDHHLQEIPHLNHDLAAQLGFTTLTGVADSDVAIYVAVRIRNAHRVPTIATFDLEVRDRQGSVYRTELQPNPERRRYPDIDLAAPIDYACPRAGWHYCVLRNKRRLQIVGGRLVLSVTDGNGVVSTDEAAIN
jgi:hypothetical protein